MTCGLSNGYIISLLEEVQQEIICKEITIKILNLMKIANIKIQKYQQTSKKHAHHTHTHAPTHIHTQLMSGLLLKITDKKVNLESSQRKYHIKRKSKEQRSNTTQIFQDSVWKSVVLASKTDK